MSNESEKPICGVCWEGIELGKSVGTPCSHTYCTTCFFKWIKTHNTCPLCRHDMISKTYEGDRRELLDALEDQVSEATLEWRDARRATRAAVRRHEAIVSENEAAFARQIRLREMLENTRTALTQTQASLEEARKDCAIMTRAAQLTASYRKDWEELWSPAHSDQETADDMDIDEVGAVLSDTDCEETIEEEEGLETQSTNSTPETEERGPALIVQPPGIFRDHRSHLQSPPPVMNIPSRSAVVEGLDNATEEDLRERVRTRFIPNDDGQGGELIVSQEFRWTSIQDLDSDI